MKDKSHSARAFWNDGMIDRECDDLCETKMEEEIEVVSRSCPYWDDMSDKGPQLPLFGQWNRDNTSLRCLFPYCIRGDCSEEMLDEFLDILLCLGIG